MKNIVLRCAAMAGVTLTAACGSYKATGPADSNVLSAADFSSMVQALGVVGAFGVKPLSLAPASVSLLLDATQRLANTISLTFDRSSPCPGGGNTRIAGTANLSAADGAQAGTYALTATATPAGCSGSGANGQVFTFNGEPGITLSLTVTAGPAGSYTVSGTETGEFAWASSTGRSGSCSINVTISGSATAAGVNSGAESGTICGRATNTTY